MTLGQILATAVVIVGLVATMGGLAIGIARAVNPYVEQRRDRSPS